VLRARGYEVMTALDGEAALEEVRAGNLDLVISDILMPGLDGYELCQRLRADPATTLLPVILVTSLDPSGERLHGIEAGAEDILKPHRREITAVFLDLRGFTAFTDRADPEEVLELLRAYHVTLGQTVEEFGGTLEHFAGDGVMIFFSDPFPIDRPAERAVRM